MTQEAKLNLPWTGQAVKASRTRYNYCTIWGRMGVKIADVQGRGRASTEARRDLIVAAVNLHGELVEALESALPFIDDACEVHDFFHDSAASPTCRAVVEKARALIAKAKVQP